MDATISAHEPPLHTEQNKPRQVQTQISDNIIIKFFLYANNRLVCANRIDPREMRNINASIKSGLIDDVEKDWSFIYRCVLCWWLSTVLICQFYKHALNICNAMRSHRYPEDTNNDERCKIRSGLSSFVIQYLLSANVYYMWESQQQWCAAAEWRATLVWGGRETESATVHTNDICRSRGRRREVQRWRHRK